MTASVGVRVKVPSFGGLKLSSYYERVTPYQRWLSTHHALSLAYRCCALFFRLMLNKACAGNMPLHHIDIVVHYYRVYSHCVAQHFMTFKCEGVLAVVMMIVGRVCMCVLQRDPFRFSDDEDDADGTSFGYKFKIHIKAREVRPTADWDCVGG